MIYSLTIDVENVTFEEKKTGTTSCVGNVNITGRAQHVPAKTKGRLRNLWAKIRT